MKKNNNGLGYSRVFARFVRIAACTMFTTLALFGSLVSGTYAGSGTWIPNPSNNDWNTAANWSCECVPGGPFDTATFGVSNTTRISLSGATSLFSVVFNVGASAYEITSTPGNSFSIQGNGISNESNAVQTFVATTDGSGTSGSFGFGIGGTAGKLTTFMTEGPTISGGVPALVQFSAGASAGSATIINQGGVVSGAGGGEADFFNNSKADTAVITNKAGVESGASGGTLTFWFGSGAANAIITSEGATDAGAAGGKTRFIDKSNAGNATLVADGGLNGGTGGSIAFENDSTGDTAQVKYSVMEVSMSALAKNRAWRLARSKETARCS